MNGISGLMSWPIATLTMHWANFSHNLVLYSTPIVQESSHAATREKAATEDLSWEKPHGIQPTEIAIQSCGRWKVT